MSEKRNYRVEEWNGHQIYVSDDGLFFVKSDDDYKAHAAEAKSVSALKRQLSVGRDVSIKAMMPSISDEPYTVTIVKVTALGSIMYKKADGRIEKLSKYASLHVYDEAREARRQEIRKEQKRADDAYSRLLREWPKLDVKKL